MIEDRKRTHIMKSLLPESQFDIGTGLDLVLPLHNALPELNYGDINTQVNIFDKEFSYPIYISGMTGGFKGAETINKELAEFALKNNIPFGIGSIRAMIEKPQYIPTYKVNEDVFLIGNIGGAQLLEIPLRKILDAMDEISADAIAVHLNPAQELIQKEGDLNWDGVLNKIAELSEETNVVIKEVGSGISHIVASKIKKHTNVRYIDTAGSGGTSWTKIEYLRNSTSPKGFENWGIPTALSILMAKRYLPVWASGGIRSGLDGAKAIMLGAEIFGMAQPFLKAQTQGKLEDFFTTIIWQLKGVMFLTGSKDIPSLKKAPYILLGWLKDAAQTWTGIPKES